jgi:hypothetical protein
MELLRVLLVMTEILVDKVPRKICQRQKNPCRYLVEHIQKKSAIDGFFFVDEYFRGL